MQKQKTLAKWLAIILLSSIAVGSYVLYDALYLKKQDNEASADIGKDNQPIEKTEDETYIPYYTTLPRKAETIDNFKVTHCGGEDDDTLIDVINFGKKRFAIFNSNSVEFDMREKGLSVALVNNGVERVITLGENLTYIDGKMSSNGVAILTENNTQCTLHFLNTSGDKIAEIPLPYFECGRLYLSGQTLTLFAIENGYLHHYKFGDSLTTMKSPYMFKTNCTAITEIFDKANGQGIVLTNETTTEICSFDNNSGFTSHFCNNKLYFKQIITAGTPESSNYIVYGKEYGTSTLYALDNTLSMLSSKPINDVEDGVILPYSDGFIFVGNGITKSYCKHLDEVMSSPNNLSFEKVTALTYCANGILAVLDDEFSGQKLAYISGENILSKPIDFSGEIVGLSTNADGFSLHLNTNSAMGIFRANFGKTDPFILDFDLSFFDV